MQDEDKEDLDLYADAYQMCLQKGHKFLGEECIWCTLPDERGWRLDDAVRDNPEPKQ